MSKTAMTDAPWDHHFDANDAEITETIEATSGHGGPQQFGIPASYLEAITADLVRCQNCHDAVGVTDTALGIPAALTCSKCVERAIRFVFMSDEPPF